MAKGDMEIRLFTDGEAEFRDLSRALRKAAAGDLEKKMRANLRKAAQPVLAELRVAVMGVQVSSSKGGQAPPSYSRQLRRRVAAAMRISVAFSGVRFAVQASVIGEGKYSGALAKYLDGELPMYRNWRHPVFGRDVWVTQHGSPYFFVTIRAHAADFEEACVEAVNEIVDEIGR